MPVIISVVRSFGLTAFEAHAAVPTTCVVPVSDLGFVDAFS